MKKITLIILALLLVVMSANVFAAVNFKEKALTPMVNTATNRLDSTRAQAIAAGNWWNVLDFKTPTGTGPATVKCLVVAVGKDSDCDSTTVVWLTSPDKGTTWVTKDSLEIGASTTISRVWFTATMSSDSVFEYNNFIARPQCDDAAAANMKFDTYLYLYDGDGQLYDIRRWKGIVLEIIAGGGI